jgi:hypothetical protein
MSKLLVNEDGSVTIPLPGKPPVIIDTPTLGDVAWLEAEFEHLETTIPSVPSIDPATASPEELEAVTKANRERNAFCFNAENGYPYAQPIAELITRVTGEPCTVEELPAWARAPLTLGRLVVTFRTP